MDHVDAEQLVRAVNNLPRQIRPPGALSIGCGVFLGIFVFPSLATVVIVLLVVFIPALSRARSALQQLAPQQAAPSSATPSAEPTEKPPADNGAAEKP